MMSKNEKTSKKVASITAKLLKDPKTSKKVKSVAASALTQAPDKKKEKMIFANTDKEITIIYSSEDHIGQQILAYAQTKDLPIHDIDLEHIKLTSMHWIELASRLNIETKDLINVENPDFLQKFNDLTDLSEIDWLKLLEHNPSILRAPIVMKGKKIVMMSDPQDMLHFV